MQKLLLGVAVFLTGCSSSVHNFNDDSGTPDDDAATHPNGDGAAPDGSEPDGGADAGPKVVYNDVTNPAKWEIFDTHTVATTAEGFGGSIFDGRYLYLAPFMKGTHTSFQPGTTFVRFDTTSSFTSTGSWEQYEPPANLVNGLFARKFFGGVFDGKSVHCTPFGGTNSDSTAIKYDTTASYNTLASYKSFDVYYIIPQNPFGFTGAVTDGRYVFYAPYSSSYVMRYDTQATTSYDSAASWKAFNINSLGSGAGQFLGAVYDGRFVYLVPSGGYLGANGMSVPGGALSHVAVRYDTQASFTTTGSWQSFDTATLDASAVNFVGGVFDGRYVYFVPNNQQGFFIRYDTQATFSSKSAWSTYKTGATDNFSGAVFDGRYVYFVPSGFLTAPLARYDTTAPFGASSSWTSFDVATLVPKTTPITDYPGYASGAFDGRYVYLISRSGGIYGDSSHFVARFDAKSPSSMPAAYHGSFF